MLLPSFSLKERLKPLMAAILSCLYWDFQAHRDSGEGRNVSDMRKTVQAKEDPQELYRSSVIEHQLVLPSPAAVLGNEILEGEQLLKRIFANILYHGLRGCDSSG
ncbi:hypothetical protein DV515_00001401 [Chloebia gouldiae]|uniref:Uncharacterized protein n=1 Tax=Chloebia gouldiae TaxID=44316 RepID=A0A3L8SY82_CHLGU|nr:hypothetical protein DV515_00001401 [Chloebia gouldiae]